ncbi:hypothetical protein Tco_0051365, partial [Tanacetum coccineum]
YVVPTSRVVVPTGSYIVPAGKVIIIVSTGRLSLVLTGRVLSPALEKDWKSSDGRLGLVEMRNQEDEKVYAEARIFRAKPEDEDINLKFLELAFPSWSQVQAILHLSGNVIEDVLQSFVADTEPEQQLTYEDFEQIAKIDLEEMDLNGIGYVFCIEYTKFEKKARKEKVLPRYNKLDHGAVYIRKPEYCGDVEIASMGVTYELGWDDFAFSVFTTNSEEVEGRPLFNRFANADSMKVVPPLFLETTPPLSNQLNLEIHKCLMVQKSSTLCSTYLIKDCDFYEKQMANLMSVVGGTCTYPQPVPTGKPKVPALVPTGRQNRSFPVRTDRGYSPSVKSGWWKSTARPMPHLNRPTSSYFQTYTPYVPQMYYNHMKYGGVRWATAVKPSAGKSFFKCEDEGFFDSGGLLMITGKGTIRTPTLDFENVYYVKELQQFNLFSISLIMTERIERSLHRPMIVLCYPRTSCFQMKVWWVFNSPMLHLLRVEMVINSPWIMPLLGTKGLASPEQTATVGLFNKATKTANYMVLEGVLMKNKDVASSRDIQLICAEFSSIQVKTQADWMLLQSSYFNPQVPTGRLVSSQTGGYSSCLRMGTPTQYLCDYWSGWVRLPSGDAKIGNQSQGKDNKKRTKNKANTTKTGSVMEEDSRRRRQPQVRQTSVESSNLEKPDNPPIVTMADNRTMAQLLEDTTEVTRNAIVIPEITANNFEIKHVFLILSKQAIFWPMIKKTTCSNPFISTRYFYDEDSEVPNSSVKLMLFSFSLDRGSPDLAGKRTPSDD